MRRELLGALLIVAGHAIWTNKFWFGGFAGEGLFYAAHVKQGIRLLNEHGYDYLAFSGGRTRPKLEADTGGLSEAEGMRNYAIENGLLSPADDRIILDPWSRDSMENIFFSMLAFYCKTGQWPARVGFVSWSSKGLRIHLIACGLQLGGRIFFHGVGDYPKQLDLERACSAEARFTAALVDVGFAPPGHQLVDPLLRNKIEFAQKRWARMPSSFTPDEPGNKAYMEQVKSAYGANDQTVQNLIEQIERLLPGDGWRHIDFPWL